MLGFDVSPLATLSVAGRRNPVGCGPWQSVADCTGHGGGFPAVAERWGEGGTCPAPIVGSNPTGSASAEMASTGG